MDSLAPKLVSLKELSIILGKSESSVRYHMRMGRIVPTIKLGKNYIFNPVEVIQRLKQQTLFDKI